MFVNKAFAVLETTTTTSTWPWILSSTMDFWDFILLAIALIVLFAWIFSIFYILWWWVLLILSWWKDEKIKPAINSIRYSLIWLAVIIISIFVFPRLAALLWLDVTKYSSPDKIFREIKIIWDKIFWTNSSTTIYDEGGSIENLPNDFSDL